MNVAIKLIVTKGCAACEIMKNLVKDALAPSQYKVVNLEIVDISDVPKEFLSKYEITDVPAICYIKDNDVKIAKTGTVPVIAIQGWINNQLFR